MKTTYTDEFHVSPRVTLRPGDQFRVTGGPYWRNRDGTKTPMAVRGVCRFIRAQQRGSLTLLEVLAADGFAVLHVRGKRRRIDPSLVCRPYSIKGRVGVRAPKPSRSPSR